MKVGEWGAQRSTPEGPQCLNYVPFVSGYCLDYVGISRMANHDSRKFLFHLMHYEVLRLEGLEGRGERANSASGRAGENS